MSLTTREGENTVRIICLHCIFKWIAWIKLVFVDIDETDDLTGT